jgi:dTDP-4-amino-4,6-dideoxygalactose transaminase
MIPFVDLQAQYRSIRSEIDDAVLRVLDSAQVVLGPAVAEFEREFAAYCRTREAVAVNSGTSALHLALLAAGIGPGDEVITVPLTFVATVAAIENAGAKPVLVDVEPDYLTMDPTAFEAAITPSTRAVVPVHLHGQPADMDPILDIARRRGIVVIEDACQAHGADYNGRRCGSMGELGCFSFYPSKNLGAYGQGGAVTMNDSGLADRIRLLRSHGEAARYEHTCRGYNYRMDSVQAAILGVKLRHLERWIEARRQHATSYQRLLPETGVKTPGVRAGSRHVYHVFAVRVHRRNTLRAGLADAGVQTGVHYPIPVHLQPAYTHLGHSRGAFPVSEIAASELLSLPMFPELGDEQLEHVVRAFRAGLVESEHEATIDCERGHDGRRAAPAEAFLTSTPR